MDTAASRGVYEFEGYVLDLVRGALFDANGADVPLRAKSFELLRLFVTNAGRLLDRDEINKAIWADVTVTDDAITQGVDIFLPRQSPDESSSSSEHRPANRHPRQASHR
jgi:DNA-binding winged helix-turn-helix (wHTH) protein